uniref:Uncharacterized protein n=1 Tax=viral metagenome TaxID=1070528 RepID=A0A6C0K6I9_9ZZZZ
MKWFHVLIVCWNIILTTNVVTASTGATYNSFVHQIGYCKMQSYDTVSRSTSGSVPMYMDGRVQIGVGLSSINTDDPQAPNLCGMCLNVTHIEGMPIFNHELTTWSYDNAFQEKKWFIAMVFDRCGDEICVRDFLDFDIYSETQPVAMGNPHNLEWHAIPCPVRTGERIEYLICTSTTCNAQDQVREHLLQEPQYYWSIILRNLRIPIRQVFVHKDGIEYPLRRGIAEASWVWDYHLFVLQEGIYITLLDQENNTFHDSIFLEDKDALASYHGGYWKQASFAY